ncbi:MAG: hypothetical protein KGI29_07180 [Pseudomonadota bacterium]|nr:hypothetical protein [Pseudomonadota bacterium]MDE3036870.1 hypothetical protein [Pseudomonadota bacterium]
MADLRVITLLPAQSVTGVQTPPGSPAVHGGAAATPGLSPGTVLSGFIVNRDASGNPILRTPTGDVTFSSNFFLKIGSEVTIRIETAASGTLAHILSVDGQPPEIAAAQSSYAQQPEVIVSQNLAPPQPQAASQTQAAAPAIVNAATQQTSVTVKATLIAPPPVASPPLPVGTQLTLTVVSIAAAPSQLPEDVLALIAPPPAAPAIPPVPATPSSYTAYARAAAPAPAAPAAPPLPPSAISGAVPTAAVPAIAPAPPSPLSTLIANAPASPPAASPSIPVVSASAPAIPIATTAPQPGQAITGTVIANNPSGETLVQTPAGIVQLSAGTRLPAGSQVTFNVVQVTPPPAPATAATAAPAPLAELAQHWASLQKIFLLLAARGDALPTAAQSMMPSLPAVSGAATAAPPPNFSTGLMLFMAALKGGDFTNWLGQSDVQWLQDQGQGDLVKKAAAEFSAMARQYAAPAPERWQALFFPVAVAGELQQARLFVKRDRRQGADAPAKKNEDTRFVVEVDLSRLGELQMDGFVRKQGADVQFDLVIRSLTPLPPSVQQDILRIYDDAGRITGYKGALSFQDVRHFPVNPMEDIVAQGADTVV